MNQRPQLGRLRELRNQLGGQERVAADHRARRGAVDAGLIRDHVDHHRARRPAARGRALGLPAATLESISSHGQRTHRVGATLIAITWIVGAHSGREGVESGVDGVGIGGEQPPEDLGETVSVAPDRQFPIAAALTTTPHRVTIGASDHLVDVSTDAALRNTAPASDFAANDASTAASTSGR